LFYCVVVVLCCVFVFAYASLSCFVVMFILYVLLLFVFFHCSACC